MPSTKPKKLKTKTVNEVDERSPSRTKTARVKIVTRDGNKSPANTKTAKIKVFMSFALPDAGIAEDLRQQLEGTERFMVIPFESSQQWHTGLWNVALAHRLITETEAFLAVFTSNTLKEEFAKYLLYEYGFAVFRATHDDPSPCSLVRVVLEDSNSDSSHLPPELMSFQTVDYRDPHSHELALDSLTRALIGQLRPEPSIQERQRYVFQEALAPNPRRELFTRVLEGEFERAFKAHIGPLEEKVQRLADLQRAQDNLMTPEIISIEEANAFDDIWVVSHSLHNDLYDDKIRSSIIKNLKKGIRYTYFVPTTRLIERRQERFYKVYGNYYENVAGTGADGNKSGVGSSLGSVRFVFLEAGVFMPFDELVVYDGESSTNRWGYIQMNYDRPTGSNATAGLVMKVPDRTLSTIVEFLMEIKRKAALELPSPGLVGKEE
jgi:hypothetical protein